MRDEIDRRVVSDEQIELVHECQQRVPCVLGGGAALSGAYLAHRLSRDLDLVCSSREDVRRLALDLPSVAAHLGVEIEVVQDAGTFVRCRVRFGSSNVELDVVFESTPEIEPPPPPIDGIRVMSLTDLRASKLTCILSRSEPRDLVDLLFLDRAGFAPEDDLDLAVRKDRGMDPGVVCWLLGQFPVRPLPNMLEPLTEAELLAFRADLQERLRKRIVPE